MEQKIRDHLDLLIARGDRELVFSYILDCLSPSYIISSSSVSTAFACLLSRATKDELSRLLPDNVARTLSSLTEATGSRPVISQHLSRIACSLSLCQKPDLTGDGDMKLYTAKYWTINEKVALPNRTENDPAHRFAYFNNEESKITLYVKQLYCRDVLVKVLMENEREIASKRFRAEFSGSKTCTEQKIQAHVNQWLADRLNLDIDKSRKLSNMWRKYIAVIVCFGPGIIPILGGWKSDWLSVKVNDIDTLCVYIRKYRPELVELAKDCDIEMAAALAHGMLMSGFPVESFDTCRSTITVIIMKLVEVRADGTIRKRTTATGSRPVVVTPESRQEVENTEDELEKAAEELHKTCIKESEKTNKPEKSSRKRRRPLNERDESRQHRTRSESGTVDEATTASTHISYAENRTVTLAETEESPDPSMSTGGDATSTTESTSEIVGSSNIASSEATFLANGSISEETQNHWISGAGQDRNLQFQAVNHEPSIEKAASLLFDFRNSQPASSCPMRRVSNAANPGQFQPSAGGLMTEAACPSGPAATIAEVPSCQWENEVLNSNELLESWDQANQVHLGNWDQTYQGQEDQAYQAHLGNWDQTYQGQQDQAYQAHLENWDQTYQGQEDQAYQAHLGNWDQAYQGQEDQAYQAHLGNWDQTYQGQQGQAYQAHLGDGNEQYYVQTNESLENWNWNQAIAQSYSVQNNVSDSRTPISVR